MWVTNARQSKTLLTATGAVVLWTAGGTTIEGRRTAAPGLENPWERRRLPAGGNDPITGRQRAIGGAVRVMLELGCSTT